MKFNVIPIDKFKKEAKRLIRKFPSLKSELISLNDILEVQPDLRTPLGNNCYKIRLAIKSKGQGKSGGARVITYMINNDKDVYLLTIFDKSELDSIDDKTLKTIIKSIKT